jgi:hypothetical protein
LNRLSDVRLKAVFNSHSPLTCTSHSILGVTATTASLGPWIDYTASCHAIRHAPALGSIPRAKISVRNSGSRTSKSQCHSKLMM